MPLALIRKLPPTTHFFQLHLHPNQPHPIPQTIPAGPACGHCLAVWQRHLWGVIELLFSDHEEQLSLRHQMKEPSRWTQVGSWHLDKRVNNHLFITFNGRLLGVVYPCLLTYGRPQGWVAKRFEELGARQRKRRVTGREGWIEGGDYEREWQLFLFQT